MRVLDITPCSEDWQAFLRLPEAVYAGDPYSCPTSEADQERELLRTGFADQTLLLATDGKRALARCSVRVKPFGATGPLGVIGAFEALEAPEAVRALFTAAFRWLRERGVTRVVGPMDGDTWHAYRLNLGPYGAPPFLKEVWNPAYYPRLWEESDFRVIEHYATKQVADCVAAAGSFRGVLADLAKEGFSFRNFDGKAFDGELDRLFDLSLEIFSGNLYYTPIEKREFKWMYAAAGALLRPGYAQFALDPRGREVGFVFAYPDYFVAVRAMGANRNLVSKMKFLLHKRRARRFCVKTVGCLPEYRGKKIGAALMGRAFEAAAGSGYQTALMCLYHVDNRSGSLDGGQGIAGGGPYRTYGLFGREL